MKTTIARLVSLVALLALAPITAALACDCDGNIAGLACKGSKCPGGQGHKVDCQDCCDLSCTLENCGTSTCVQQCHTVCYEICNAGCSS